MHQSWIDKNVRIAIEVIDRKLIQFAKENGVTDPNKLKLTDLERQDLKIAAQRYFNRALK